MLLSLRFSSFSLALALPLCLGSLNAQTSQISISASGQGTGTVAMGANLSGSGTVTPFGNMTLSIVSAPGTVSDVPFTFTFTFSSGNAFTATSTGADVQGSFAGTASITGGTGQFLGAAGSFQYTLSGPDSTANDIQFTMVGSGSLTITTCSAALQASPGVLTFAATSAGQSLASQTLTVLSGCTGQTGFTVSLDGGSAGTSAPSWLSVTPLAGTTPAVLTVSVNPSSLNAGSFSGRILLTPAGTGTGAPTAVAVNLTVAAAPAQLSVAPASLRFSAQVQSPGSQDQVISVSNTGSGTLSFTGSTPNAIPWLTSVTPSSGQ